MRVDEVGPLARLPWMSDGEARGGKQGRLNGILPRGRQVPRERAENEVTNENKELDTDPQKRRR